MQNSRIIKLFQPKKMQDQIIESLGSLAQLNRLELLIYMNETKKSYYSFTIEDDLISQSSANTSFIKPRPFNIKPFTKDFGLKGAAGYNLQDEIPVPAIQKRIQEQAQNQAYRELNNDLFNPFQHKLQHDFANKQASLYERQKQKQIEMIKKRQMEQINSNRNYTIVFNNNSIPPGRSLKVAANNILSEEAIPAISDYYQMKFKNRQTPLQEISDQNDDFVKKDNFTGDKHAQKRHKVTQSQSNSQTEIRKRLASGQKHKIVKSTDGWKRQTSQQDIQSNNSIKKQEQSFKNTYSPINIPKPPPKNPSKPKQLIKQSKKQSKASNNNKNITKNTNKSTSIQSKDPNPNLSNKKKFSQVYEGPDRNLVQLLQKQISSCSQITFDDIAELQTAKNLLQQAVVLPRMMPDFFKGIRKATKGILLFGPPGTGKTLLAKAVASNNMFFNVSASSLASKWKGESQKMVRLLFQMARYHSPSVIFFDEIDCIATKRSQNQHESTRKVKTELLVQMDGIGSTDQLVFVLAATNRPWDLDEALRRRLQKRIYIALPGKQGRKKMFQINLKELKMSSSINWQKLVELTKGCSGADISNICRDAAYMPMRKKLQQIGGINRITELSQTDLLNQVITESDLIEAATKIRPSVGSQDLKRYADWMKQFGSS